MPLVSREPNNDKRAVTERSTGAPSKAIQTDAELGQQLLPVNPSHSVWLTLDGSKIFCPDGISLHESLDQASCSLGLSCRGSVFRNKLAQEPNLSQGVFDFHLMYLHL